MNGADDCVLRAITQDGGFRVIAARTTQTVGSVLRAQEVSGRLAHTVADMVTATSLFRETMSPNLRAQAVLRNGSRSVTVVADSRPGGGARGLCQRRLEGREGLLFGPGATLEMMRSLPNGSLHRGTVEVSDSRDVADALMNYLQSSEQVLSMVSVGSVIRDGELVAAGGYLVQLLPELTDDMLLLMTERLETFDDISTLLKDAEKSPQQLLELLLDGIEYSIVDESPISFECDCSHVRVMTSLATLNRQDISEMMRDGQHIEMSCDFCSRAYKVSPEQLRGLLSAS